MRWLAGTLLALLALAYAIVALSGPSAKVHPAPDDPGLGGLSLLARALRDEGYRTVFDPASHPKLKPDDIAVVPLLGYRGIPASVLAHVRAGGRAFVIAVPEELQAIKTREKIVDRKNRSADVDSTEAAGVQTPDGELAAVAVWYSEQEDFSTLRQIGKGRVALLESGALATNRFLGRHDNARVVFSTLGTLRTKKGDRLTFLALGYGEGEELGPIEAIGPWAVGALWQSLAILGAFGLAKGVRFGLPIPERRHKRGSRELLDTLADHYRRGRRTDAPLLVAAREHPSEPELQTLAIRSNVPESEARQVLMGLEARAKKRR